MSIFQNFKNTDHSVEKIIFSSIIGLSLSLALFFLADNLLHKFPDVKKLFVDNTTGFRWFQFSSIGVFALSNVLYFATLDFWEAETKYSIKVSLISVVLWIIIWLSWSIFCAWLTLTHNPLTASVKFTIVGLVTIPGLTAYLLSKRIRKQILKQEAEDKRSMGADYSSSEPYYILIDRKHFSGYYGLVCLPVYLVSLLIGQLL